GHSRRNQRTARCAMGAAEMNDIRSKTRDHVLQRMSHQAPRVRFILRRRPLQGELNDRLVAWVPLAIACNHGNLTEISEAADGLFDKEFDPADLWETGARDPENPTPRWGQSARDRKTID